MTLLASPPRVHGESAAEAAAASLPAQRRTTAPRRWPLLLVGGVFVASCPLNAELVFELPRTLIAELLVVGAVKQIHRS